MRVDCVGVNLDFFGAHFSNEIGLGQKKYVCLRFADRPCFIAAGPTFFFLNKKKRDRCPVLLERSRILVTVFKFFYDSIRYVVKPFVDTFGFCQSKMATFSSLFCLKKCNHQDRKSLFEATSHHQMT